MRRAGAAVLAAALLVPAAAAATSTTETLRGSPRVASGARLRMTAVPARGGWVRVAITLRLRALHRTRIRFSVYPCGDARCSGHSTATVAQPAGLAAARFRGKVPLLREVDSAGRSLPRACVVAKVVDAGGRAYRLRTRSGRSGTTLCLRV